MCSGRATAVLSVVLFSVMSAAAAETHVFLGNRGGDVLGQWRRTSRSDIKCEDGYFVAGEHVRGTTVSWGGNEVDVEQGNGIFLSKGKGFQLGGGTGTLRVRYPSPVSLIEVVYIDTSAIPPSNGCDLSASARSSRASIQTLNVQLGGDFGSRGRLVHQYFVPAVGGAPIGMETTVRVNAFGYDEFQIFRISLYSGPKPSINTTFVDGANGRQSRVLPRDSGEEHALFVELVASPLKADYERGRSAGHVPSGRTSSTAPASGESPTRLIDRLNRAMGRQPPAELGLIRREVEQAMLKRGRTPLQFYGVFWREKPLAGKPGVKLAYKYRTKSGRERVGMYSAFLKDGQWSAGALTGYSSEDSLRRTLLRRIEKAQTR